MLGEDSRGDTRIHLLRAIKRVAADPAHRLQLLILPMHKLLDQPMIGAAVAKAGAGRTLPRTARPEQIRDAMSALLGDRSAHAAAAAVGARLRGTSGARTAATAVEELLGIRRSADRSPASS